MTATPTHISIASNTTQLTNVSELSVTDIIVIGAGAVGIYFIKELIKRSPDSTIKIFGDEPYQPYNRIHLTDVLAGKTDQDSLFDTHLADLPTIDSYWDNRIEHIDHQANYVIDRHGVRHYYQHLVLALGSTPRIPNIPGVSLKNVFTFRDLTDTQALMERQIKSQRTVVIGGGLLGIEAAHAMQRFNTDVVCIEHSTRLMFNQLDDKASLYLEDHLIGMDIETRTNERVTKIIGTTQVKAVQLGSGEIISCDTIILSTGIIPNVNLARRAKVRVGSGIRVNDHLQTSAKNVYAIGECAEHNERIYGVVTPGYEQAAVLAEQLSGGKARYSGSTTTTQLKVLNYPVFSMGETNNLRPADGEYIYRDPHQKIYRKLILNRGRLQGAIAVGDWPARHRVQEAVEKKRFIWPWQYARFVAKGELWPKEEENIASWPANAVVCNCMRVTRGILSKAMKQGNTTPDALCQATGASSVCGSCRPLLNELTQSKQPQTAIKGARALWTATWLSLIIALIFYFLPAMPYERSVQSSFAYDMLWRDSLYKQISGFTLLGLSIVILLLSARKRIRLKPFTYGDFSYWRMVHVLLGALTFGVIFIHTGFRFGHELNFLLMMSFSLLMVLGAIASGVIAQQHRLSQRLASRLRNTSIWLHIILFWPIPVLLTFHIFKSYYF